MRYHRRIESRCRLIGDVARRVEPVIDCSLDTTQRRNNVFDGGRHNHLFESGKRERPLMGRIPEGLEHHDRIA